MTAFLPRATMRGAAGSRSRQRVLATRANVASRRASFGPRGRAMYRMAGVYSAVRARPATRLLRAEACVPMHRGPQKFLFFRLKQIHHGGDWPLLALYVFLACNHLITCSSLLRHIRAPYLCRPCEPAVYRHRKPDHGGATHAQPARYSTPRARQSRVALLVRLRPRVGRRLRSNILAVTTGSRTAFPAFPKSLHFAFFPAVFRREVAAFQPPSPSRQAQGGTPSPSYHGRAGLLG